MGFEPWRLSGLLRSWCQTEKRRVLKVCVCSTGHGFLLLVVQAAGIAYPTARVLLLSPQLKKKSMQHQDPFCGMR